MSAYVSGLQAHQQVSQGSSVDWISRLPTYSLIPQKRQSLDHWTAATFHGQDAYNMFVTTSLAKTPDDAESIFETALSRLVASVSWMPYRRPPVNLRVNSLDYESQTSVILKQVGLGGEENLYISLMTALDKTTRERDALRLQIEKMTGAS